MSTLATEPRCPVCGLESYEKTSRLLDLSPREAFLLRLVYTRWTPAFGNTRFVDEDSWLYVIPTHICVTAEEKAKLAVALLQMFSWIEGYRVAARECRFRRDNRELMRYRLSTQVKGAFEKGFIDDSQRGYIDGVLDSFGC